MINVLIRNLEGCAIDHEIRAYFENFLQLNHIVLNQGFSAADKVNDKITKSKFLRNFNRAVEFNNFRLNSKIGEMRTNQVWIFCSNARVRVEV